MNGGHDLGGMHGLGPIDAEPEAEEPPFHAEWEKQAFALTLACGMLGRWNIDMSRHARERQHPADYLRSSYYEIWMTGLETLLVESGLTTADELASGTATTIPDIRAKSAEEVEAILISGGPTRLEDTALPRFSAGEQVRVVNDNPTGHTRAPRYVRGRIGTVDRLHGSHVFADENARGNRVGAPLYSVRFEASELWGTSAPGRDAVYVDLWEPYLEEVT